MQLKLSLIRSAAQPVRTSRDEQKLDELAQSIKEHGLLQAIKVRPVEGVPSCPRHGFETLTDRADIDLEENEKLVECSLWGDCKKVRDWIWPEGKGNEYYPPPEERVPFEIVYGHRRVEACKRLGLTHIEAVVEGVDDPTALIQSIIENVQREGLDAMDKARALKALQDETGWSAKEVGRQGITSTQRVGQLLALLKEPEVVQKLVSRQNYNGVNGVYPHKKPLTEFHVRAVRHEDLPEEQHIAVLQKAAEEGLTAQEARTVAQDLKTFGTTDERVARAQQYIEQEKQDKEKSRWDYLNQSPCARNFIRHIKVNKHHWRRAWQDVERGALGIEHMPYVEELLRKYAEFVVGLADDLKKRREEAVGE